jgi:hypothetical protein
MKKLQLNTAAIFLAALLLVFANSCKQPEQKKEQAKQAVPETNYKMTTATPPGIAAPDKIETRFGTLNLFDGFPDKASSELLFDNLDFQRAVQAYLLALPPLSQISMRAGLTKWGPANSTVLITEQLMNPKSLFLTGNNNTPYSIVWIDLSNGPIVVEIPPKVLGIIDNMWYHWVSDVGITGPDKGEGGKYLLIPPGYDGKIPNGYFVLHPETFGNLIFWRSFLVDGSPVPGVESVKAHTRIYPLSEAGNPPTPTFVNISGQYFNTISPGDYHFWELLNEVVQKEPAESMDPVTLGFFQSVGIQKGKPFAPDARMKKILTEAAATGDATARAITYRFRDKEAYFYENSAWRTVFMGGYTFSENGALLLDSKASFFFYATGVTPAMAEKMIGKGSQYALAFVDSQDKAFDGSETYKLHLPANIPVKDFWSIMIYSNQTRSMLQTDQEFPSVSSQTKGIKTNTDGSVDVYFGPVAPAGEENNWIQTIPGKGYSVALRLYGPTEPWFDKTWRPGEIELAVKN